MKIFKAIYEQSLRLPIRQKKGKVFYLPENRPESELENIKVTRS